MNYAALEQNEGRHCRLNSSYTVRSYSAQAIDEKDESMIGYEPKAGCAGIRL